MVSVSVANANVARISLDAIAVTIAHMIGIQSSTVVAMESVLTIVMGASATRIFLGTNVNVPS